ncbi:hypothetical protein R3P38DRAFT_3300419 [Favolaschia claudopus]|uniref:Uncharacterized protein n=1 Tax=Favolaschia claudopus TaxID=2862362 RepID=A0AAV9YY47_9AGAR
MHSIHTLPHRAQPATRSRVRWQPYNASAAASTSSLSSRSPSISYLNIPTTSVSPSPTPKPIPLCARERLKAQTPRNPSNPARENKSTYATGLVDEAVKSLCEIWCRQDIPNVILTSSKAAVGSELPIPPPSPPSHRRNAQLPPTSPFARTRPPSPLSSSTTLDDSRADATALQNDQDLGNRSNLVPIKGFVHEVLRRSRTSGAVLQTALCYLEAIRPKVPELLLIVKERSGQGGVAEFDSELRVTPATAAELELEAQLSRTEFDTPAVWHNGEDVRDTVHVCDNEEMACTAPPSSITTLAQDATFLAQQQDSHIDTPLPSPLLCPRRAFLASLILASKFTQDTCYSNRAWAKLSGLPAREISQCERALMNWRLWSNEVTTPIPTPAPVATGRPVVRSGYKATLNLHETNTAFLVRTEKKDRNTAIVAVSSPVATGPALTRGLRRSSTIPADAFAEQDRIRDLMPAAPRYKPIWIGEKHQLSFSNITQQDQDMDSPEFNVAVSPCSPSRTSSSSSPIPPTPGLSYSPSTESSSGDRTIQMSTFMDDNMAPLSQDTVMVAGGSEASSSHWGVPMSGVTFEAASSSDQTSAYATAAFSEAPV